MIIRDTPTPELEAALAIFEAWLQTGMNRQVRHATEMKIGAIRLTLRERQEQETTR